MRVFLQLSVATLLCDLLWACASVTSGTEVHTAVDDLRRQIFDERQQRQSLLIQMSKFQSTAEGRFDESTASLERIESELVSSNNNTAKQERDLETLQVRLAGLEKRVTARSSTHVHIDDSPQWHTVYGNATGRSQLVLIRHVGRSDPIRAVVRIRVGQTGGGMPAAPVLPLSGESPTASWDLTLPGALRAQRLDCGQEVQALSEMGVAELEVSVRPDPHPHACQ